jgi:hypothetical protein
MRKLKRMVARNNMKKAGLSRIHKGDFFSKHWREYVGR